MPMPKLKHFNMKAYRKMRKKGLEPWEIELLDILVRPEYVAFGYRRGDK